jgi:hypothetical protein
MQAGVISGMKRCVPPLLMLRFAGALGLLAATCLASGAAQASMIDQIIFNKCSSAMREDFQKAAKTPPEGMVADTCNCVVEQVKNRKTIEEAKTFCSQQSLKKYGQP